MKRLHRLLLFVLTAFTVLLLAGTSLQAQRQVEALGRGVVVVRKSDTEAFVAWRMLGNDPSGIMFNVYRQTNAGAAALLNSAPLAEGTHFTDSSVDFSQTNSYFVRPVISGVEQPASTPFVLPSASPVQQYLRVALQRPDNGTTPTGEGYSYTPNDASAGDLDGDGEYELVLKWEPTNAKDSSQDGYTGNTFIDAYELDGTRLWRIDLGVNIRAGAHDTPFIVYDFDGDGRAEVVIRTAAGSKDGAGNYIADPAKFSGTFPTEAFSHTTDYRNSAGRALVGPEFLTIFDGLAGTELTSTRFLPARHPDTDFPTGAQLFDIWGDSFGNRQGRFYPPGVAYLDGQRPSIVMGRGYAGGQSGHAGRVALAAWNWRNGVLSPVWHFDSRGHASERSIAGSGAHNASVADLDGDGRDDLVYGQVWVRADGTWISRSTWGHGDALHVTNMDPDRAGQQVFMPHESAGAYGPNALSVDNGPTADLLFGVQATGDIGRGVAADVDPRFRGYEMWGSGSTGGLYNVQQFTANATLGNRGTQVAATKPGSINHVVWWDDDLLRELLDGTTISKWNWNSESTGALLSTTGVSSNNGSKSNPSLQADLFGDWREEVIWRESTNDALRIYTTTIPTTRRFATLMHDTQYRVAIAWQNVGYNQPPHPGFFLGDGMNPAPSPLLNVVVATPMFRTAPSHQSPAAGSTLTVASTTSGAARLVWDRNGTELANESGSSLTVASAGPEHAGLYTATATSVDGSASVTAPAVIVGVTTTEKVIGTGSVLATDIQHPNGNIFDQIELTGAAEAITADAGKVTRTSFVDLSHDIVQVEFAGPGTLSLVFENASPRAEPQYYNQAVNYVRGHPGIVVTGATKDTHLSVFSVGRATAVNQALFKSEVTYDGIADIAFIAIQSADGSFGGLRTANARYWNTKGLTGVYAPGVTVTGPLVVHDIEARDAATPVLIVGGTQGNTAITGGDLAQPNGRAVQVKGLTQLRMADGTTSHYVGSAPVAAEYLNAQTNAGRLEQDGVDVTAQVIVNP